MTPALRLPDLRFTKATLDNGLDVIVRHQPALPLVAVNLWYHVGSKDEERRQRGFAHLFEHLMFEGSEHYPGDFFKPLQRLGASINGSTSSDRTNYFEDVPAAHAELALAMESDRLAHLVPALTEAKLRVQKDVVKNEYRQNYANRPYGMVWRLLAEALYPPGHPYSWQTIGLMEDVEAATLEDVGAFFHRFYVPGNASLCLAGDIEEGRALELAERYFGPIAGGSKALPPWTPEVRLDADRDLRLHDRVELERSYRVWPTVRMFEPDDAPLTLLADVLARGKSSRLYRSLVVEREIAQDVTAYQSGRELAGSFGTNVTLRPGHGPKAALGLIDEEIARLAEAGPTDRELDRVKNGRLAGFLYALENLGGFGGVADRLNAYNVYLGDPARVTTDFDRFQAVTPDEVRAAAGQFLAGRPRVTLTVSGKKPLPSVAPLDRAVAPASAPTLPFRVPRPEVRTLRCGVPLWVVPSRDLPIVAATVVLGGGAGVQGPGQAGLAQLTAGMMDEGTGARSSLEIAEAAESMGSSLSTSSGWDGSYLSLQCLTPHLEATLDLAADVLLDPTFPATEWQRLHGQTLAALRAERDSAEARAHRGFLAALYPEGHPYRLPVGGAQATVAALTRDDAAAYHRAFHGPGRAAVVVAGDVDPDALARALDDRLGGWQGLPPARPEIVRPDPGDRPRVLVIDRPGAAQAVVRVGHPGTHRLDPDFTDLTVFNHVLGGQFTSRLNAKLREEKGFTYGIRSHFDFRRGAGPFSVSASLQADRIAEALDDLRGEVLALLDGRPATAAEIDDARRSLVEGQARHFETPSALVSRFAGLFAHGLPPDDHSHLVARLDAVTPETVREAAARHVFPGSFVAVVVLDADRALPALRKLGWAEVEVVRDPA